MRGVVPDPLLISRFFLETASSVRLCKVRISGFKTFPEPTSIIFAYSVTGIVGPNGCGKSNIVDAIRWVIGDAAHSLRAGTLDKVIFDGTNIRKPLGRASVELHFDNEQGGFPGRYAGFSDLVLRREVSRGNESAFFINETRCRRRDIVDFFSGTGLGGNSYAIVGQGVIENFVQAKPRDLRNYLEEAAGLSLYRDRRRDTKLRLRRTRENLERLEDIREEVRKQFEKTARQARQAERYKKLLEQQKQLQAELLCLQLLGREKEQRDFREQLEQLRDGSEQLEKKLKRLGAERKEQQERLGENNGKQQESKEDCLKLEREIAVLEHEIENRERNLAQLHKNHEETERVLAKNRLELEKQKSRLEELHKSIQGLEKPADGLAERENTLQEKVRGCQNHHESARAQRQSHQAELRAAYENAERQKSAAESFGKELKRVRQAGEKTRDEQDEQTVKRALTEQEKRKKQLESGREACELSRVRLEELRTDASNLRRAERTLLEQLEKATAKVMVLQQELASLEALQKSRLGHDEKTFAAWLESAGLNSRDCLCEHIRAEKGWESLVETVLGDWLQAVCVPSLDDYAQAVVGQLGQGELFIVEEANVPVATGTLATKVDSPVCLEHPLASVGFVDSLDQGLAKRKTLLPHESLLTPDGIWIGKHWLKISRSEVRESQVLLRARSIDNLRERLENAKKDLESVRDESAQARLNRIALEESRDNKQSAAEKAFQAVASLAAEHARHEESLAQENKRQSALVETERALQEQEKTLLLQRQQAGADVRQAETRLSEQEQEGALLQKREKLLEAQLLAAREELNSFLQTRKIREAELASLCQQQKTRTDNIEFLQDSVQTSEKHLADLQRSIQGFGLSVGDPPDGKLASLREAYGREEKHLVEANEHGAELKALVAGLQDRHSLLEKEVDSAQKSCEQISSELLVSATRCEDLRDRLAETEEDSESVRSALAENASESSHREQLEQIQARIQSLGVTNAAAADELAGLKERKAYLDGQHEDLSDATGTLLKAMTKIDRETRTKFNQTFEKVNANLECLFPVIFGGGYACLEMEGRDGDWMEVGVRVSACLPGHKAVSVGLLSGGEKTLVSLALVFSMFQLNPAPFCVLDEVDASLDENNVMRFCDLLQKMKMQTQFMVVTHNKIAMEAMDFLVGVTMAEAGVSKVVSVDIERALQFVEG